MQNPKHAEAFAKIIGVAHVSTDAETIETHAVDWSGVLKPNASGILFPASTEEVAKLLRYANENRIAIVPSGGRTGLSGGAVAANGEWVLSLKRMNKMGAVDATSLTLEVECGAITEAVHRHCEPHGLTWPVDFASKGSSQVGGNLATNAGGVRVIRYGNTRNWVLGITAVTMTGEILRLNGALEKNNTGIDLRQILIGSEGILAIMTEAVLKLARIPEAQAVGFFAVKSFQDVLKLFEEARVAHFALSAYETLSRPCYDSVVDKLGLKAPIVRADEHGAYVLIEFELGANPAQKDALLEWFESLFEKSLVLDGVLAQTARESSELWKIRESVAESIMIKSEVYQQDVSVPLEHLNEFFASISERYRSAYPDFETYIFGHIGDGNLHVFIRKPGALDSERFRERCHESDQDLFEFVKRYRGSVSAEHGIGVLKRDAIRYSRSDTELALFSKIKLAFDPNGLLNPGKILP